MNPFRRRWQAWLTARHPRSDTHAMGQRNIYIVPSRPGLFFCATVGVLLLASINDQLSLGYMLSFLLAGAGLASMQATHGTLRGLNMDLKAPEPVFAGEEVALEIRLHNAGRTRYGIGLRLHGGKEGAIAWTDVPAQSHAVVHLRYAAPTRGLHELPTLQIITRFPLGLFRAWSLWRPAARAWVYPHPVHPTPPFAPQQAGVDDAPAASTPLQKGQDFEGVRPYRQGDSVRQVLWKKASLALQQGQALPVRETHALAARQLWLDWRDARGADAEARLSMLAAWVLEAERVQAPYGLRMGGVELPCALGPSQRQACLEKLALA